jgi:hypothetical protein
MLAVLISTPEVNPQDNCPADEVWAEVGESVVHIHHHSAEFNCCPVMAFEIDRDGPTIDIYEIEVEPQCYCICCFDLRHELSDLEPGDYTVRVWGAYGCETTPCGLTDFTVPAARAVEVLTPPAAKTTELMSSFMSDCGGWTIFSDGFESGSTSAWSAAEQ